VERPLLIRTVMYWGEDTVGASTDGGVGVGKGPAQAVGRGADDHQISTPDPPVGFTVKRDEIRRLAPAP
jgi:hypothetical protein